MLVFRKIILRIHLWLGFASGILLFAVAFTGCLLAFEDELRRATQSEFLYVEAQNKLPLSVQQILEKLNTYDAMAKLNQIRFFGDPTRTVHCYTRNRKIIAINPYDGKVEGIRDNDRDWLSVVLSFHRTLLLGKTGENIILWNAWIFLTMLVSGLILWLPPKLKHLRENLILKRGLPPMRKNLEWHRMLGLYAWIPLVLIAITGISMASGHEHGKKITSAYIAGGIHEGTYDRMLRQVYHHEPIDVLRVNFPKDSTDIVTISIRYKTNGLRKQTNFTFDQYSEKLLNTDSYLDKSFSDRFFGSSYEIHTGRIMGIFGKILMFLSGLVAMSLPITGFLIWKSKR
jgi:uncharacterized iron-regulated membrane protein